MDTNDCDHVERLAQRIITRHMKFWEMTMMDDRNMIVLVRETIRAAVEQLHEGGIEEESIENLAMNLKNHAFRLFLDVYASGDEDPDTETTNQARQYFEELYAHADPVM